MVLCGNGLICKRKPVNRILAILSQGSTHESVQVSYQVLAHLLSLHTSIISIGGSNTVVSAYTLYRHLQQYRSLPLIDSNQPGKHALAPVNCLRDALILSLQPQETVGNGKMLTPFSFRYCLIMQA